MSGINDEKPCPRCGNIMQCYSDYKPHETVAGWCLHCGFEYMTTRRRMPKKELAKRRKHPAEDGYEKGTKWKEPKKGYDVKEFDSYYII